MRAFEKITDPIRNLATDRRLVQFRWSRRGTNGVAAAPCQATRRRGVRSQARSQARAWATRANATCVALAPTPPTVGTSLRATRTSTATRSLSTATSARSSSIAPTMSRSISCACIAISRKSAVHIYSHSTLSFLDPAFPRRYDLNRIRRASNKAQQQTQAPPQPQPAPQSAPQPQQAASTTPLYYTKPPGEPPPTPAVVNAPSLEYRASPVKLERAVLAKADGSSVLQLPQHKLQVAPSAGSQPAPPPVSAPAASAGPVRRKVPPPTERPLDLVALYF